MAFQQLMQQVMWGVSRVARAWPRPCQCVGCPVWEHGGTALADALSATPGPEGQDKPLPNIWPTLL